MRLNLFRAKFFAAYISLSLSVLQGYAALFGPGLSWQYVRQINLSTTTPASGFQIQVTLTTAALGTPYSNVGSTGSDLRFYDSNNDACSYWIESWDNSGTSTVWVNVPDSGISSVFMFYGNTTATSTSNGKNTFDFFDDFSGSGIASNWVTNTVAGTISVTAGNVTLANINAGYLYMYSAFTPAPVSNSFIVETKHYEGAYFRNRFYVTYAADTANSVITTNTSGSPTGFDYGYFPAAGSGTYQSASVYWNGFQSASLNANTDYLTTWEITDGSSYNWNTYTYPAMASVYSNTTTVTPTLRYLVIAVSENASTSTVVDWVRVRQNNASVPVASVGAECNNNFSAGISAQTNVSCNGQSTGSAVAAYTGGGSPHTYIWTNAATTDTITGLAAGTYVVTITEGCAGLTVTDTVIITQPPLPVATSNGPVCIDSTVDLYTSGGTAYAWSGPNGFASGSQNPSISTATFAAGGTYTVTVTNAAGCSTSASASTSVSVNASAATATAGGPDTVCQTPTPSAFVLSGASVGGGATTGAWSITSGGGTLSSISQTGSPELVTYTAAPNYTGTVVLTLTTNIVGGCTGVSNARTITVITAPVGAINAGCVGGGRYTLTSSSFPSYIWSDTAASTTQSVNVGQAGVYTVTVTGTNTCTASASYDLGGELVANGNFSAGNTGFTTGSAYNYYTTIGAQMDANNYAIGPDANAYHNFFFGGDHTNPGTGNLLIVNASTTSSDAWLETVTVSPNTNYYFSSWGMSMNQVPPYAQVQLSVNGTVVSTGQLPAGANNTGGPFVWYRIYGIWNSGSSTTANLSISDLSLVDGGNDFALDDISFSVLPPVSISLADSSSSVVCAGNTISLFSNATGGYLPLAYAWSGPSSYADTAQNPTIASVKLSMAGSYNITVTDNANCTASATTSVLIDSLTVTAGGPDTVCQTPTPSPITLSGASVGGGATTGAWSITSGGGTLSNTSQTGSPELVTYTPAANYSGTVVLTLTTSSSAGGCIAISDTRTVTVIAAPVPTIALGCADSGSYTLTSSSFPSYIWNNISASSTQSITVAQAGIYVVIATGTNTCTAAISYNLGGELVTNGDFSAGNTGFTTGSAYNYYTTTGGEMGANNYAIGSNANVYHDLFFGTDHTKPGAGNLLIVNASTTNSEAWQETVTVNPNTTYYFSAWAMSMNSYPPFAQVQLSVNGTAAGMGQLPSGANSTGGPFTWYRVNGIWNSGASTTANLSIKDLDLTDGGNDFALDDISFSLLPPFAVSVADTESHVFCADNTIHLNATPTGGYSPLNFSWSGPLSFASTSQNPDITNSRVYLAGNYSVTVTDYANCTTSAMVAITVDSLTIVSGGPDTVCQAPTPSAFVLSGASVGGGATTGAWSITSGGGTLSSTSQTSSPELVTYTPAANFTGNVVLTLTTNSVGGCTPISSTRAVNVIAAPVITIDASCGGGGSYTLNANTFPSYIWNNIGASTTQSITSAQAGIYTVTVTGNNSCTAASSYNLGGELVANGDFSAGNTGFTTGSAYSYYATTGGQMSANHYAIGPDANTYHNLFYGTDHTNPGGGNLLIVNASTTSSDAWQETVTVSSNTTYYFSAWAMSMNQVAPYAQVQLSVNGTAITSSQLPAGPNSTGGPFTWYRIYGTWNSGASTTANLSITDLSLVDAGRKSHHTSNPE